MVSMLNCTDTVTLMWGSSPKIQAIYNIYLQDIIFFMYVNIDMIFDFGGGVLTDLLHVSMDASFTPLQTNIFSHSKVWAVPAIVGLYWQTESRLALQLGLQWDCAMTSIFLSHGDRPADEASQCQDIHMTLHGSRFFERPIVRIGRPWALNLWPLLFVYPFLV